MKQLFFLFLLAAIAATGCRTTKTAVPTAEQQVQQAPAQPSQQPALPPASQDAPKFDWYEQTSWLLGYFEPGMMKRPPHSEWYINGYDDYMPSSEALNRLIDLSKDGLTMKIVLGSWCPDSRREVPRMMRILDLWQFPASAITFIGVDNNKVSPIGDYEALNIERVPTFIIYKNNVEAGRIIEVPVTSLEQDIVNILQEMKKQ